MIISTLVFRPYVSTSACYLTNHNSIVEDIMITARLSLICMYETNANTATVLDLHNWLYNMEKDKHVYKLSEEYVVNVRTY